MEADVKAGCALVNSSFHIGRRHSWPGQDQKGGPLAFRKKYIQ